MATEEPHKDHEDIHRSCYHFVNNYKKKTWTIGIRLGYFKQGDDLSQFIENTDDQTTNVVEALEDHSNILKGSAHKLDQIREIIAEYIKENPETKILVDADTHRINMTADADLLRKLVRKGLVNISSPEEREYLRAIQG